MRIRSIKPSLIIPFLIGITPVSALADKTEAVSLFDGKTLAGWHAIPRLYVPRTEAFNKMPSAQLKDAVVQHHREHPDAFMRSKVDHSGVWKVEDGAISGGQVPGTVLGAYLMSDKKYGDFDLTFEARPDFPTDTGIMIRAHEIGTIGFQILLDYRPNGAMAGVYGNGLWNFRAFPFVITGDEQANFKVTNLREGQLDRPQFKPEYAAPIEDFLKAWKLDDWNTVRVRCVGEIPIIETWINGVRIAKFDTNKLGNHIGNFDPQFLKERLGSQGHIALEVHDSPNNRERWAPGAVSRWRNIQIKEL